jgi:hypothetical protein
VTLRPVSRRGGVARAILGPDEILLVVALALLAVGGYQAWPPLALVAPGLVLLWIVLPSRRPFVVPDRREGPLTRTLKPRQD